MLKSACLHRLGYTKVDPVEAATQQGKGVTDLSEFDRNSRATMMADIQVLHSKKRLPSSRGDVTANPSTLRTEVTCTSLGVRLSNFSNVRKDTMDGIRD